MNWKMAGAIWDLITAIISLLLVVMTMLFLAGFVWRGRLWDFQWFVISILLNIMIETKQARK